MGYGVSFGGCQMRIRATTAILLCMWLALGSSCAQSGGFQPSPKAARAPRSPTGPLAVASGQQFALTLESNRTTGYQWQLAEPLDGAIVTLVGTEYATPEARLPGAAGREIWTFQAVGQGKTMISLEYVRPWEKDVPPAKTADFLVVVD